MKSKYLLLALLLVFAVFLGRIGVSGNTVEQVNKLKIIATLPPQGFIVEEVGGKFVEVTTMVPPDGSPHSSSLTPAKLRKVRKSDIYFKVGTPLPFEVNNISIFKSENPDMTFVDTSRGVELKAINEHYGGNLSSQKTKDEKAPDPHIWLAPSNLKKMAENVYRVLATKVQDKKSYFRSNLESLYERVDETTAKISEILDKEKGRSFLVYHPAWGYFGDQFNLKQVAVEEKGNKPGPQKVREIAEFARKQGIATIITSSQFDPSTAKMVANTFRGSVSMVNPLSGDILDEMIRLANQIQSGYSR